MSDEETGIAAFNKIFEWIKGGKVISTFDGGAYAWSRHSWRIYDMRTSPAGPYKSIFGPGYFVVYLRPERSVKLDFRAGTNLDHLINEAAKIGA